jgi:hypothetical protein
LTKKEEMNTSLEVADGENATKNQAYVVSWGSKVNAQELGIEKGTRVLLQGQYIPVPSFDSNSRVRALVTPSSIKAILTEAHLVN